MKILVFSDTHLSARVFPKKLHYLKSIIEPADRVIIAGDFWDGFLTTADNFAKSRWSELFPLLKERQAIYLYGNHDRPEWNNQTVNLFSVEQALAVDLEFHGRRYMMAHGHTIFTSYEDKYPIINRKPFLRLGTGIDMAHKLIWGRKFLAKPSDINDPMRQWAESQLGPDRMLICGHSHYPELDQEHRIANPGFIGSGFGNHAIIDENGVRIIKERY